MLDQQTILELAAQLDEAERTRTQLRHFSRSHPDMTIDDG
ncbi:MAG TPA: 2-oxo-hepta-3-ene-1,7-dioic acid hydratase, partial [Paraburkholderia sp.]|nr:2-oxo-hepta-3-ene-1,7-dioic acid hydratase [Paraburkholderia sp.]